MEEGFGGSQSEISDELSEINKGKHRKSGKGSSSTGTMPLVYKAVVVALIVTIFSLPQVSLISLQANRLSFTSLLTVVFLINLVIIAVITAVYEFAMHRKVSALQVLFGGIFGAVIASTILSFSWVNNIIVYPLMFVVMAAVFFATYWVVRELTEPRTYKNIVFFVLIIILIFVVVKYGLPLLGVKSSNTPINSLIPNNGLSRLSNSISSGISALNGTSNHTG